MVHYHLLDVDSKGGRGLFFGVVLMIVLLISVLSLIFYCFDRVDVLVKKGNKETTNQFIFP